MKPADLGENNLTVAVNHDQGWYSPDPEAGCGFSPYRAPHVEA
jgi:hypothetical protein